MKFKTSIPAIIIFIAVQSLPAAPVQAFPDSYINFRDTVYMQNNDLLGTMRLYAVAKQDIENNFSGTEKYLALSRCEYLIGITFRAEGKPNEAAAFFEQGIAWAEESLEIHPTSEGYRMLGMHISFLSEIKPAYGIKNCSKIEKNAKKAIEMDSNNLMAHYLLASYYILAPWPLSDISRGMNLLREILNKNYIIMDKEDLFNLYLMLQVACLKQKQNNEAKLLGEKAEALYATNNFISLLVKS